MSNVNKILSKKISISSNEKVFKNVVPKFNNALKPCGYNEEIKTLKTLDPERLLGLNSPFSINVKTNVAKRFLQIVTKPFAKTQNLNRNTLKVSYSCSPNISIVFSQ